MDRNQYLELTLTLTKYKNQNKKAINWYSEDCLISNVDPQGFEPQMTEPKSVVLPLHHGSVFLCREII